MDGEPGFDFVFFRFLRSAGPRGQSRASSIGYLRFASFGCDRIFPPLRCIRFECRFSDSAVFRFVKITVFRKNEPFGCMDNTKRHASNGMMRVVLSYRRFFARLERCECTPVRILLRCGLDVGRQVGEEIISGQRFYFGDRIWCSSGSFRPNRRGEAAIHRPSMPKRSCPKPLF